MKEERKVGTKLVFYCQAYAWGRRERTDSFQSKECTLSLSHVWEARILGVVMSGMRACQFDEQLRPGAPWGTQGRWPHRRGVQLPLSIEEMQLCWFLYIVSLIPESLQPVRTCTASCPSFLWV